ncbi:MAG: lipoprotein [Halieaceae bacterium]|jgi:predicted small lipoprotein YifL|nr:lipoprotein [Halieaceae bacterium]
MRYLVATLALAAALSISACGQMGPLYEPEAGGPVPAPPQATTTLPTP